MEYNLIFTAVKVEQADGYLKCPVSKNAAGYDMEFFISAKSLYGASIVIKQRGVAPSLRLGWSSSGQGEKSDALIGYLNEAWDCRVAGKFRKVPIRVMHTPLNYEDTNLPNLQISFSDKDLKFFENVIRFISGGD